MKYFDIAKKVAFVTGGNRGLGRAMAEGLAEAGVNLFMIATNERSLEKACADIHAQYGVECDWQKADITDEKAIVAAADKCVQKFGRIDILLNNAGTDRVNIEPEDNTLEQWKKVIDINVNGMFIVAKAVGKQMIKQKEGKVINIASISGTVLNTVVNSGSYDVSKLAVVGLTRVLAIQWAKHNIGVNAIAPGHFMTDPNREACEQIPGLLETIASGVPLKRWGDPDELKGLVIYLASPASSYMQGSIVVIDGGLSISVNNGQNS